VNERYNYWKTKKVDSKCLFISELNELKKKEEESIVNACKFKPEIHANNIKHNTHSAKEIVNDPESYENYIKKRQLLKIQQLEEANRQANAPGSGNIWKDKLTIPKEFNFSKKKEKYRSLKRPASSINIVTEPSYTCSMDLKVLVI
jgi:hypothetical protein